MNDKIKKFVNVMYKILGVAPVVVLVVFTVLFTFVLKDRLEERILHSATTFLLWMFASVFYIMVIANFKNRKALAISAVGMLACVALAILVTPLDRYVGLCFTRSHIGAYILAAILLVIYSAWYICSVRKNCLEEKL